MNFYVTFFIGTYYLALSISRLLFLFIFSFVISYFPYFKLVTVKTLVILCNTLKKEGRAFRNIGKNISLYCVISLANFCLLFSLLLIRSSTARGSGTSILLRWSLQKLTSSLASLKGGTLFGTYSPYNTSARQLLPLPSSHKLWRCIVLKISRSSHSSKDPSKHSAISIPGGRGQHVSFG